MLPWLWAFPRVSLMLSLSCPPRILCWMPTALPPLLHCALLETWLLFQLPCYCLPSECGTVGPLSRELQEPSTY